jgi:excisionase family DNA binding protein
MTNADQTEQFFIHVEDKNHTVAEVAKIFNVTPLTVRTWINNPEKAKRLDAIKIGKSWHISRAAMVDYVNRMY